MIPHKIATVSVVVVATASSAQYSRRFDGGTSWRRRAVLLILMLVMLIPLATAIQSGGVKTLETLVDCCSGPHAVVDCSSGIDYKGQVNGEIRRESSAVVRWFRDASLQIFV